jgi:hypothetical protein
LASALGALSNRLDSSFVIAFWLPACVAIFGAAGVWTFGTGFGDLAERLDGLDSITQGFLILALLLGVTLLAFILRALARPIAAAFAGDLLPQFLRSWMRGQQVRKHRARRGPSDQGDEELRYQHEAQRTVRQAPEDEEALQATRIGNLMAVASEHPRLAYAMDGLVWWPRLAQVTPSEFRAGLNGVQYPLMALLNLSLVFVGLAITAILAGIVGHLPVAWVISLVGAGLLLANLCYRAAVSQAMELSSLLCVGFDLYRHEVLRRMDIAVPQSLEEERSLWQALTREVLALQRRTSPDARPRS